MLYIQYIVHHAYHAVLCHVFDHNGHDIKIVSEIYASVKCIYLDVHMHVPSCRYILLHACFISSSFMRLIIHQLIHSFVVIPTEKCKSHNNY